MFCFLDIARFENRTFCTKICIDCEEFRSKVGHHINNTEITQFEWIFFAELIAATYHHRLCLKVNGKLLVILWTKEGLLCYFGPKVDFVSHLLSIAINIKSLDICYFNHLVYLEQYLQIQLWSLLWNKSRRHQKMSNPPR